MLLKQQVNTCIILTIWFAIIGCTQINKNDLLPMYIEATTEDYTIPKGYNSYTILFSTSYDYQEDSKKEDIDRIRRKFQRFGKSIGENNLAIWLKEPSAQQFNVELGKTYADQLHSWHNLDLNYSNGPYLVFLNHNPSNPPTTGDFAVCISFLNKSPEYMSEAIEFLEASIRRNEINKADILSGKYWLNIQAFVSTNSKFFKELLVKISDKYI